MFKGILGFLLFIFFVFVFIAILIGGRVLNAIRKAQKAAQKAAEEYEQRQRAETGRQRQQYSQRAQNTYSSQNAHSYQREEEQPQARRTQTTPGETIIDHRHQERENKKIFDDSDGEYVDFVEES